MLKRLQLKMRIGDCFLKRRLVSGKKERVYSLQAMTQIHLFFMGPLKVGSYGAGSPEERKRKKDSKISFVYCPENIFNAS